MIKKVLTKTDEENICEDYKNGIKGKSLRKKYNITHYRLKEIFEKNNIKNGYSKKGGRKSEFSFDETFFEKIDTESKAYILGFFYADGYITGKKLGISLNTKDIKILEKIKKEMKSNHNINSYETETTYGKTKYSRLIFTSEKVVKDAQKLGLCYKKTNILTFPTEEQVPTNLIHHFIRGYFDGDGSAIPTKQKSFRISFLGTENFLTELRKKLPVESKVKLTERKKGQIVKELKIGGNKKIEQIFNFLYENANIYLERKINTFINFFEKN